MIFGDVTGLVFMIGTASLSQSAMAQTAATTPAATQPTQERHPEIRAATSFMVKMWRFSLTLSRKKKQLYPQLILNERSHESFYLKKTQKLIPT